MDTDIVKQALLHVDPRAANHWHLFEELLEEIHVDIDTMLAHAGRVPDTAFFIVSGIVRAFTVHQDAEVSLEFSFPGQFATAYAAFVMQTPSVVSLQALTPVSAFSINRQRLYDLYEQSHEIERMGRLIAEAAYVRKLQRELSFLQFTAKERYLQLIKEHPEVIQLVPNKLLASYLGVKPESLSRLKKSLYQKCTFK